MKTKSETKVAPKPRLVPPGNPPNGYRFLRRGEVISSGDKYYAGLGEYRRVKHTKGLTVTPDDIHYQKLCRPIARATPAKKPRKSVAQLAMNYSSSVHCPVAVSEMLRDAFTAGYRAAQRQARKESAE